MSADALFLDLAERVRDAPRIRLKNLLLVTLFIHSLGCWMLLSCWGLLGVSHPCVASEIDSVGHGRMLPHNKGSSRARDPVFGGKSLCLIHGKQRTTAATAESKPFSISPSRDLVQNSCVDTRAARYECVFLEDSFLLASRITLFTPAV